MKKLLVITCVLVLAIGMLAGCGNNDKKEEPTLTQTPQEETTKTEDVKTDAELVQEYINANQADIDAAAEEMKELITMEVLAEDSALVYKYTYLTEMDVEATKQALDVEMPNQEAVLRPVLNEMKVYGVQNPVIIVRNFNNDGTEIANYEFK